MENYTRNGWERCKTTLETSVKDSGKLIHSVCTDRMRSKSGLTQFPEFLLDAQNLETTLETSGEDVKREHESGVFDPYEMDESEEDFLEGFSKNYTRNECDFDEKFKKLCELSPEHVVYFPNKFNENCNSASSPLEARGLLSSSPLETSGVLSSSPPETSVVWITRDPEILNRPIPPCSNCGAGRVFEFQIQSMLLYYLNRHGSRPVRFLGAIFPTRSECDL
jgi:hypothetical protein